MLMALEALEGNCTNAAADPEQAANEDAAITALRQALETEHQPVAWIDQRIHGWPDCFVMQPDPPHTVPLYTAPPKREWVGLTDEEVSEIIDREIGFNSCYGPEEKFARAIEQALKEKNGG